MANKGIAEHKRLILSKGSLPVMIATALLLLCSLILLIIICYHTFPVPEDYRISYDASRMWGMKFILFCYQNIDGRWFTNVLYLLNPLIIKFYSGYSMLPLLLSALLGCSVFSLFRTIFGHKYPVSVIFLLTVVFLIIYISLLPDFSSFLCFMGATFSYTVPLILLNYLISELIKFCLHRQSGRKEIAIISVLVACVCGTNESYLVTCLFLLAAAMIYAFFRQRSIARYLLIPFLVYIGIAVFSLSSPGNSNRISVEKTISKEKIDSADTFSARLSSAIQRENISIVQTVRSFLATPLFISASLLFFGVMLLYSKKRVTLKELWPYFLFGIVIILFIFYFIPFVYYFSGLNTAYIYHSRIYNIVLFLFLLIWMLILSGISAIVTDKIPGTLKTFFLLAAIIAAILSLSFSDNNFSTLIKQLQNNKLKAFRNESVKRLNILNNVNPNFFAGRKLQSVVILNPLQHYNALTFSQDLIPNDTAKTYFSEGMAGYFGFREVLRAGDTIRPVPLVMDERVLHQRPEIDCLTRIKCKIRTLRHNRILRVFNNFNNYLRDSASTIDVFKYFDSTLAPMQMFSDMKRIDSTLMSFPSLQNVSVKKLPSDVQQSLFIKQVISVLKQQKQESSRLTLIQDYISKTPLLSYVHDIDVHDSGAVISLFSPFNKYGGELLYTVYLGKSNDDYKITGFGSFELFRNLTEINQNFFFGKYETPLKIVDLSGELCMLDSVFSINVLIINNAPTQLKNVRVVLKAISNDDNKQICIPFNFILPLKKYDRELLNVQSKAFLKEGWKFELLWNKPVNFAIESVTFQYNEN